MIVPTRPRHSRGRHRSLEEAAVLVGQWQASDLSQRAWCSTQGIAPTVLRSCLHRTKRQLITAAPAPQPFIELHRRPPPFSEPRVVRLSLTGSVAVADLTIDDLSTLIHRLSGDRT